MDYLPQFITLAGVMLLACISPGPDLIAVSSHALQARRAGVHAALGIATAHALWATLAIFGLGLLLNRMAWMYDVLRLFGAVYLIYLGLRTLWGVRQPTLQPALSTPAAPAAHARAYRRALLVGLTNPKAVAFFGSLFIAVLPAHAPRWAQVATLLLVTAVSLSWFTTVAWMFSTPQVQAGYARLRRPLDALMGTALIALGARMTMNR